MKARLTLFPEDYPGYFAVIRSGSRPGQEKEAMVRRGPVLPGGARVYVITSPAEGPAIRFDATTTKQALAQMRNLYCDFVVVDPSEAPPVQLSLEMATCEICGRDFAQNHTKQKYCDAICSAKANSDKTIAAQRARSKTVVRIANDPPPFLVTDWKEDERITARLIRRDGCMLAKLRARRQARREAA